MYSLLPPTPQQLHWDPSHERIDGVTWKDYGTDTVHPRALDKGDDREANQ